MSGFAGTSAQNDLVAFLKFLDDEAEYRKKLKDLEDKQASTQKSIDELAVLRDTVAKEKASVDTTAAATNTRVTEFNATRKAILEKEKGFDEREAALVEREKALELKEAQHKSAADSFDIATAAKLKEFTQREKVVSERESNVSVRDVEVADKEKNVADKLAKLQSLMEIVR